MADINLNDLLEKKQADSQKALPAVDEKHEVAHFNAQVESLTPEERQQVDTIKDAIDLVNSNAIVQYGSAAQKNIATFSDSVFRRSRVRTRPQPVTCSTTWSSGSSPLKTKTTRTRASWPACPSSARCSRKKKP